MHWDIIVTLIVAVFGSTGFWSWVQARSKRKSAESRLLLGIGYSEIVRRAEEYLLRGYVSTDDYKELYEYLYEPYREMGGNGTAGRLMDEVRKLPTEREQL